MRLRFTIVFILFLFTSVFAQKSELCENTKMSLHIEQIKSLYYKKHIKEAASIIDSLLLTAKGPNDQKCLNYYTLLYERGNLQIEYDKLGEGLIIFHDLIEKLRKTSFKELEAHCYLSIALIHELMSRKEACFTNLQAAGLIIAKHQLFEPRTRYYVRFASYQRIMNNNKDSCLILSSKAVENISFAKNYKDIGDSYFLLYACTPLEKRSQDYRKQASMYNEKAGDFTGAAFLSFNIYNDLYFKGNKAEARKFLEVIKTKYLDHLEENTREKYTCMAMYHEMKKRQATETNDIKAVLQHTELLYHNQMLAQKMENQSALNKVQDQFLYEIEQKKTLELEEKSKMLYSILYSSFLALALLIGFLYYGYRSKSRIKKQKDIIEGSMLKIKELNHKNEILLSEVHHRVKNSLQNVISILSIKKARSADVEEQDLLSEISNRVNCISLIHEQLYQNEEYEMINPRDYIGKICVLHYHISNGQSRTFAHQISIDKSLFLNIDTMMPIGIIVNELITNSIKHANTNQEDLQIYISLIAEGQGSYKLIFNDNGNGEEIPYKEGMGYLVINSMIKQLNGSAIKSGEHGFKIEILFKEKTTSKV